MSVLKALSEQTFFRVYLDLMTFGRELAPRGLKIIEITNYEYTLLPYVRFANFDVRKLNVDYIKNEFLWYLKGDRYDDSITKYAKMWNEVKNPDGSINSNYGQYIFGGENQFNRVFLELCNDKDSRRASIIILKNDHFNSITDVPCTYSINFRIRDDKLEMTVRMRSQDAVYGMCSDVPIFSFIHEMMFCKLKNYYPDLQYGNYMHSADSFHAYEKHFKMIEAIINNESTFNDVNCPAVSCADEVDFIRKLESSNVPDNFKFCNWLYESIAK